MDAIVLDAIAETVDGEGAIEACIVSQPLRGGAGDGGADHLITIELPGAGRGGNNRRPCRYRRGRSAGRSRRGL